MHSLWGRRFWDTHMYSIKWSRTPTSLSSTHSPVTSECFISSLSLLLSTFILPCHSPATKLYLSVKKSVWLLSILVWQKNFQMFKRNNDLTFLTSVQLDHSPGASDLLLLYSKLQGCFLVFIKIKISRK